MMFELHDFAGKAYSFDGEVAFAVESAGVEHSAGIYRATFTLYRVAGERRRLIAAIELPGDTGPNELTRHTHVMAGSGRADIFDQLGRLDIMQHTRLPHWNGSCAMLDADLWALLRIRLDIMRAMTTFMEKCVDFGHKLPL